MHPEDIPYELHLDDQPPPERRSQLPPRPQPPTWMVVAGVVIAALAIGALVASLMVFVHNSRSGSSQTSETRVQNQAIVGLQKAAIKQAGVISAADANIRALDTVVNQLRAIVPLTVTCADLKKMDLTTVTGASIQAGGTVGIGTQPVPMVGNCK